MPNVEESGEVKVALVTGGSRGLGAAMAEALADQGADVAISYVASARKAREVVAKLKAKGVRALAVQSDQANPAAAQPLVDKVTAHFGKLDILINNAAIAVQGKTGRRPGSRYRQSRSPVADQRAGRGGHDARAQRRCCRTAGESSSSAPSSALTFPSRWGG